MGFTRPGPYIYEFLAEMKITYETVTMLIDIIDQGTALLEDGKLTTPDLIRLIVRHHFCCLGFWNNFNLLLCLSPESESIIQVFQVLDFIHMFSKFTTCNRDMVPSIWINKAKILANELLCVFLETEATAGKGGKAKPGGTGTMYRLQTLRDVFRIIFRDNNVSHAASYKVSSYFKNTIIMADEITLILNLSNPRQHSRLQPLQEWIKEFKELDTFSCLCVSCFLCWNIIYYISFS